MFEKKALTIKNQIDRLIERGLAIEKSDNAESVLSNISYYRLGEYWHSMQYDKEQHLFKENSKFKDVIALYNFDGELRILLFDVIEKIEISLRTKLIYHLSHEFDPWWFQNFDLFIDSKELVKPLANLEEELSRTKDVSIKNHTYLPSWLQSIAQIRNYCAHHSRLWNKNLPGTPKLLYNPPLSWIGDVPKQHEFQKLYVHLCVMKYMLNTILPNNNFSEKLISLFDKYQNVDPNALGMKINWKNEPLWLI